MEALQESTTVIIIKDSDPLCVETRILTKNSPVLKFILEECQFEEHDLSDFNPDAVRLFLTLLDDGKMDNIEETVFREINKMAVVFQIAWLQEDCRKWVGEKILAVKNEKEETFIFEECFFMLKRLEKKECMKMFTDHFGRSDDVRFISNYLSDFEHLEIDRIYPLLQLGGSNSGIFFTTVAESIRNNPHLSKNALYLLQNINLGCFNADWEKWADLFDEISILPEISMSDLRITQQLSTKLWRAVNTGAGSTRKDVTTMIINDEKSFHILVKNILQVHCNTLAETKALISEGKTNSMSEVVQLVMWVFDTSTPSQEEMDSFIFEMEELCEEKQVKRVPWQFIDPIISVLNHANKARAENLVSILKLIRQNTVMSSPNRENIKLRCYKREVQPIEYHDKKLRQKYGMGELKYKLIFKFKHPAVGRCTLPGQCGFIIMEHYNELENTCKLVTDIDYYRDTGVHYHNVISARDMCYHEVCTLSLPDGCKVDTVALPGWGWWYTWVSQTTKMEKNNGSHVTYNVSDYMVAKPKL